MAKHIKAGEKVFVIIYRIGTNGLEFLCLKLSPEPGRSADYYAITGGVEGKESFAEAALRETEEEIGIKPAAIIDLHHQMKYQDHLTREYFIEHCFVIRVNAEAITLNEEHTAYKWVSADEFISTIWWDDDRSELQQMVNALQDHKF
jgi:8-oxo-dGTP pyrophosphatase MutT (NUDIX family)